MEIRKTDPWPYFMRTWFYINFYKTFLSVLKISKTFVFYLRTSDEYLTSYKQGSVWTEPWKRILKKRILIQISLNIHMTFLNRKQKFLVLLIRKKTCFIKINVESSPQEIWIKIRFLEKNGSPSLVLTQS